MKKILVCMAVATSAHWLPQVMGDTVEGKCLVVRRTVAGDESPAVFVTTVADVEVEVAAPNGQGPDSSSVTRTVVFKSDEGDGPNGFPVTMRVFTSLSGDADPSGGWLGVAIGQVSSALADQLDVEDQGIMILNVVKDGPADVAGMEPHDILLSINGELVSSEVAKAVSLVKSHEPGDVVSTVVLRDGEEVALEVELGARADMKGADWVIERQPDTELIERIHTKVRMLRKDDEGNWIIDDLGGLGHLGGMAQLLLPHSEDHRVQVFVDGNSKSVKIERKTEDGTIMVEREDEGPITVTRTNADGHETVDTFDSTEALADADAEAAEILEESHRSMAFHIDGDGGGGAGLLKMKYGEDCFKWHEDLRETLEDAGAAYGDAMEDLHKALREALERADADGGVSLHELVLPHMQGKGLGRAFAFAPRHRMGKPKHSFQVDEDGGIEVSIRKGDSELVRKYIDADDLADRDPALYEKYANLIEVEDEE